MTTLTEAEVEEAALEWLGGLGWRVAHLQRAFARDALRGRSARRAELTGLLQGAPPWEKTVHFREGVGRWEAAATTSPLTGYCGT